MKHLLSSWREVAPLLKSARRILLLTDYDGTLTPIVDRPEVAHLPEEVRDLLRRLARQRRITLGVISGRALVDLKERVGVASIVYAGNHGLEIEGPGIAFVHPVAQEIRPALRLIHHVLNQALDTVKGVFVENKGLSLTVHYRLAEDDRAAEIEAIVKQVVGKAEAAGKARVTSGKKVQEVRPAVTWDKGKAIKLLMKKYGRGGRISGLLPIYIGDDRTDEDAFRVIDSYGQGISVYVGEPDTCQTCALFFVRSPQEVIAFLRLLMEEERR